MSSPFRVATAVAVIGALGAASVVLRPGDSGLARAASLQVPVIREPFTALPCTGSAGHRDTIQEEGCAEQRILRSDAQINSLSAAIFALLSDPGSRRDFIAAQQAWLRFRKADCLSRSDQFREARWRRSSTPSAPPNAAPSGCRSCERSRATCTATAEAGARARRRCYSGSPGAGACTVNVAV